MALTLVALLLAWLVVNFEKSPSYFFTIFFIGLTNGAVYALVALGYTLVYGILELINFAHGDVFMLGGMMSATVLTGLFSLGEHPSAAALWPAILATVAGVTYTWNKLIVVLITVPVLTWLIWLVQRTRQGKAMRATAQDRDAAAMMGINVNRTISFTFAIAGALAGAAGILYTLYYQSLRFDSGFQLGLIAFTAAVLGGIGNLTGAVLGGMLIGFIQAFNEGLNWRAPGSNWTESIVFSILILILVFRPEGLLGERTPEGGEVETAAAIRDPIATLRAVRPW